jgi:hypothetical protein
MPHATGSRRHPITLATGSPCHRITAAPAHRATGNRTTAAPATRSPRHVQPDHGDAHDGIVVHRGTGHAPGARCSSTHPIRWDAGHRHQGEPLPHTGTAGSGGDSRDPALPPHLGGLRIGPIDHRGTPGPRLITAGPLHPATHRTRGFDRDTTVPGPIEVRRTIEHRPRRQSAHHDQDRHRDPDEQPSPLPRGQRIRRRRLAFHTIDDRPNRRHPEARRRNHDPKRSQPNRLTRSARCGTIGTLVPHIPNQRARQPKPAATPTESAHEATKTCCRTCRISARGSRNLVPHLPDQRVR